MTIADLSTVWVTALVPEKDLGMVSRDQDAEVDLPAYPDRLLRGKVRRRSTLRRRSREWTATGPFCWRWQSS